MVVTRRRRVVLVAIITLTSVLALAGCGGSSDPAAAPVTSPSTPTSSGSPRTTGTSPPSSSTTGTSPDAQAFDSYLSALKAFDHALSDPPDPNDPLLSQTMVDPMLTQTSKLAGEWRGFGQAERFPPNSVSRITLISSSVDGSTATLEACSVDDGIVYEPASGKILNDKVTTAHDKATLTLVDGTWKLATREQVEKWEGVAGCALASS